MRRRLFHGIGACALSASLCLAMAGCTFSETITQTIYDQDEKNEVDDTQTLLVNTLNAKRKTDQLPKLVTDDRQKEKQDTTENLPSYGGDTSKALVAKPRESKKKNEQKAEPEQTDTAGEQQSKGTGSNSSAEEGRGDGSSRGTETDDEDGRGDAKGKDGKNPKESGGTQSRVPPRARTPTTRSRSTRTTATCPRSRRA